jgi:hypothetical protein
VSVDRPFFAGIRTFDRIEILCPDDRWHPILAGALQIRVFGGVARRTEVLDTLAALQTRFHEHPGILTINIRRHHGCGFQVGGDETPEDLRRAIRETVGHDIPNLPVFTDPVEDVKQDLDILATLPWLPGTIFSGYITDVDSLQSTLVGNVQIKSPIRPAGEGLT